MAGLGKLRHRGTAAEPSAKRMGTQQVGGIPHSESPWLPVPLVLLRQGPGEMEAVEPKFHFALTGDAEGSRATNQTAPWQLWSTARLPLRADKMQQPGKPERAASSCSANQHSQQPGMSCPLQAAAACMAHWPSMLLPCLVISFANYDVLQIQLLSEQTRRLASSAPFPSVALHGLFPSGRHPDRVALGVGGSPARDRQAKVDFPTVFHN